MSLQFAKDVVESVDMFTIHKNFLFDIKNSFYFHHSCHASLRNYEVTDIGNNEIMLKCRGNEIRDHPINHRVLPTCQELSQPPPLSTFMGLDDPMKVDQGQIAKVKCLKDT